VALWAIAWDDAESSRSAVVLFTVASVACGAAPNIGVLIAARCVQGVGGACLVPGSLAIISAAFDPDHRGKAIGTWAGFTTITTVIGPVLGGFLVQQASWRLVFFINVPLAALTLFLLYRYVPESRDEQTSGKLDWMGALCITGALGGIVFGLIEAGPLGFGDPVVGASLAGGLLLLVAFVVIEAHAAAPMMPLRCVPLAHVHGHESAYPPALRRPGRQSVLLPLRSATGAWLLPHGGRRRLPAVSPHHSSPYRAGPEG